MRFASFLSPSQPTRFGVGFETCLLAALLIQSVGVSTAQTETSDSSGKDPSAESQGAAGTVQKDAKKADKYDVNRIGQRGIGHGFNLYSARREQELGRSLAAAFDHTTRLVKDEAVNEYISRLAQRIVRYSDADVAFTVKVIDSDDIPRAYGLPGGFLYVDSALILASESEAELAGVLAHEIAHVAARHATRALTRKRLFNVMDSMAFLAGPAGVGAANAGGMAGPLSVKKFSRDAEYEADLLGIEYAYAAGYDPQALLDALEKLHVAEARRNAALTRIPGYHFATHLPFHSKIAKGFANYPVMEERINRLQGEITTYLPNRKDYILDTNEFQEVKARLIDSQMPVLRRVNPGEQNGGPVLRRSAESSSEDRILSTFVSPNADIRP